MDKRKEHTGEVSNLLQEFYKLHLGFFDKLIVLIIGSLGGQNI